MYLVSLAQYFLKFLLSVFCTLLRIKVCKNNTDLLAFLGMSISKSEYQCSIDKFLFKYEAELSTKLVRSSFAHVDREKNSSAPARGNGAFTDSDTGKRQGSEGRDVICSYVEFVQTE